MPEELLGKRGAGSASSSRSSTAAGSRSPRWGSGSRRALRPRVRVRAGPASSSESRSRASRRSSSRTRSPRSRSGPLARVPGGLAEGSGRPFALEAAMAKLFTGELSARVAGAALQIHGGFGYMEEAPISRLYQDQKILEIGRARTRCSAWSSPATSACSATPDPHDRRSRSMTGRPGPPSRGGPPSVIRRVRRGQDGRVRRSAGVARRHRLPGGATAARAHPTGADLRDRRRAGVRHLRRPERAGGTDERVRRDRPAGALGRGCGSVGRRLARGRAGTHRELVRMLRRSRSGRKLLGQLLASEEPGDVRVEVRQLYPDGEHVGRSRSRCSRAMRSRQASARCCSCRSSGSSSPSASSSSSGAGAHPHFKRDSGTGWYGRGS